MKCPYCSQEMKNGYFNNGRQPLQWIPSDKKPSAWAFAKTKGGVDLRNSSFDFWQGYSAAAYYCASCHIVLAQTTS